MVEKKLNNTTPYRKIRASHEGSLHSSTLNENLQEAKICFTITCKYGSDYCNIAKLFHFGALYDYISNVSVE